MEKIKTKPELSIIIAHYESYKIKKVLNSFLSDKKLNLEVILIDDNPSLIRKKYLPLIKDNRLKIIQNKKNIGPLNSFLYGIKISKGQFLLLSSDHDFYRKMSLKKIIKPLINNKNFGASFCNFNEVDEEGKNVERYCKDESYFNYLHTKKSIKRAIKYFLDPEYMGKANMFYSIFRKKLFDTNKFKKAHKYFGLNADRIFLFDFIQKNKIYIHKDKLFNVIIHDKVFYENRRKKSASSIIYFYQQIKGYVFFSNTFALKILIIIFLPYKLYQIFLRKFLF
jgi:hypothetical protein